MSNVVTLRSQIVASMTALQGAGERFNGVKVSAHGGEFDTPKELERYSKHTPHVVIAVLKVDGSVEGTQPYGDVTMGAFCFAANKPGVARDVGALALTENVMDFILRPPAPRWSVTAGPPFNVISRNLYDAAFDERDVALWGVFWEQRVELAYPVDFDEGDFSQLNIEYDLSPRDNDADLGDVVDAEDEVILED